MKLPVWMLILAAAALSGCATHVSQSKQQQVEMATETGPYSYERAISPMGPR
ncbi:MAG: hypothetical protein PHC88_12895 [Terrimicrobiaceae bacterium]|nr:hypothetical protein [Terrimicrobiaceae bacterium]